MKISKKLEKRMFKSHIERMVYYGKEYTFIFNELKNTNVGACHYLVYVIAPHCNDMPYIYTISQDIRDYKSACLDLLTFKNYDLV